MNISTVFFNVACYAILGVWLKMYVWTRFQIFFPPVLMKCELPCLYVATWWNSFILLSAISKQWQPSISGKAWRNLSFLNNKLKRTCYLTYHGIMVLYGMLNQYEKKKKEGIKVHFVSNESCSFVPSRNFYRKRILHYSKYFNIIMKILLCFVMKS